MQDILSPTHAFLDFDFSEFIDKNFDVSNGILSPNTSVLSSCSDFLSQSTTDNYTHDHPLWPNIEELAFETSKPEPPSFTCIDDFINDPTSDLVDLVQKSDSERSLFQSLITRSITPDQIICDQQFQQEQERLLHQKQELHDLQQQQPMYKQQHEKQFIDQFHPNYYQLPISHQKKQKNNAQSQVSKRSTKVTGYSTSNNSNYTHSDSVNAQLLRELIRQAGRNNKIMTRMPSSSSVEMTIPSTNTDFRLPPSSYYAPMANGNYHTQQQGYCMNASDPVPSLSPASSHSSRHQPLPYHSSNRKPSSVKLQKSANHPYQRSAPSKSTHMGKPSMYSSDISQAQLLEIQAISRAQQDFIRAREQQEAEKEMMIKHQKKVALL
jgi:hypothetical protein